MHDTAIRVYPIRATRTALQPRKRDNRILRGRIEKARPGGRLRDQREGTTIVPGRPTCDDRDTTQASRLSNSRARWAVLYPSRKTKREDEVEGPRCVRGRKRRCPERRIGDIEIISPRRTWSEN